MKKLFKDTRRISLISFFFTFLFVSITYAKSPEMMVTAVKGNAFLVSKGKTVNLKPGDHIYDFQEVFTEVGGQLTVKNFNDKVFHFAGGSSAKILKGFLELQNGYLWIQSNEKNTQAYKIQTPNSVISFDQGEAIIDFDHNIVKTQILVLNGDFEFSNLFESFLNLEVSSGKFSFISKDYNNGAPRNPTPVGSNTFTKLQALFDRPDVQKKNVTPIKSILTEQDTKIFNAKEKKARSVASIVEIDNVSSSENSPEIIYRKTPKRDTSIDSELSKYYKNKVSSLKAKATKKKIVNPYRKKTGVKISIYGQNKNKVKRSVASIVPKKSERKPASVFIEPVVRIKKDAFESSLNREYKKQLRHNKEVNSLINELKSYDQDYKQSY